MTAPVAVDPVATRIKLLNACRAARAEAGNHPAESKEHAYHQGVAFGLWLAVAAMNQDIATAIQAAEGGPIPLN